MELIVLSNGFTKCIYADAIGLSELGKLTITRASHVEPNSVGNWIADLSPVGGPKLGPFERRTEALAAEIDWLRQNWLLSQD